MLRSGSDAASLPDGSQYAPNHNGANLSDFDNMPVIEAIEAVPVGPNQIQMRDTGNRQHLPVTAFEDHVQLLAPLSREDISETGPCASMGGHMFPQPTATSANLCENDHVTIEMSSVAACSNPSETPYPLQDQSENADNISSPQARPSDQVFNVINLSMAFPIPTNHDVASLNTDRSNHNYMEIDSDLTSMAGSNSTYLTVAECDPFPVEQNESPVEQDVNLSLLPRPCVFIYLLLKPLRMHIPLFSLYSLLVGT